MLAGRLFLFAWSWRKPLLLGGVAVLLAPLTLAMMLVGKQQVQLNELAGELVAPVGDAQLTQTFGCTSFGLAPWSAQCPGHHFHSGIDLAAPMRTPVLAASAGIVSAGEDPTGYGLYLVVVRDPTLSTLYGHLDARLVKAGESVKAGQEIGLMGSTGNSTGPHLHFEVRIGGLPVDPRPLYPKGLWGGGAQD